VLYSQQNLLTLQKLSAIISRKQHNKEGNEVDLMEVKILNTAIERVLNKEMAELDITYTQATVIGFLKKNIEKEICQKDIEHSLGLTHPTVSSILSRLEEKSFIVTTPLSSDRRYKKILLTNKSLKVADEIQQKIDKISENAFVGVSKEKQNEMSEIIQIMVKNISE
jgi:DNA-binding MarR family transcriptional regulator